MIFDLTRALPAANRAAAILSGHTRGAVVHADTGNFHKANHNVFNTSQHTLPKLQIGCKVILNSQKLAHFSEHFYMFPLKLTAVTLP